MAAGGSMREPQDRLDRRIAKPTFRTVLWAQRKDAKWADTGRDHA